MKKLLDVVLLALLSLLGFTAYAYAAGPSKPDEPALLDLLRPVVDAFRSGHHIAAGALAVVFLVALAKRYAPGRAGRWLHGDAGGIAAVFLTSVAGAIAVATADGTAWAWSMLWTGLTIGAGAAGGFAAVKKLLIVPLLASSWYGRAPAWVHWIAESVMWIFEPSPIASAEAAGAAAVEAHPSPGVEGSLGKPETF